MRAVRALGALPAALRALRDDRLDISPAVMRTIFWIGAGSFVPLLFLQYVGEEPLYTIVAQEMWAKKEFISTSLYGGGFGRPGIYSWLILLLTGGLGADNILVAARLITVTSTLSMGLTLAWLVRKIFKDDLLAAFSAAVFLSGDVLLYRGWLAYADPFFSALTFAAMAGLWVAVEERRRALLPLAALALIGSFLAKALTGYVFYGVLGLILLWRHPNRRFLLTPLSFALHAAAAAFPFVWDAAVAKTPVTGSMLGQIVFQLGNVDAPNLLTYIALFLWYPLRTFWYLLPVSAVVAYSLVRGRFSGGLRQAPIDIVAWTLLINVLPYWFTPGSSPRYVMPLYPFAALLMSFVVLHSGKFITSIAVKTLVGLLVVAYVAALAGFPLYERYIRGSYREAAQMILARAGNEPIYATDVTSVGLSIVANLNVLRAPQPPVTFPPSDFASGYVIAMAPDGKVGPVDKVFALGRNADGRRTRYLLCRGAACGRP
jgi:4-amino-4-deoxy-L-arabinose transferase-like glycosyltransferase